MFDFSIGGILAFFGIGGVGAFLLGMALKFGLGGALLGWVPGIVVKALTAFVELVFRILSWFIETVVSGTESIFSGDDGWKKGFAVLVFVLMAGYVGDKYDPWHSAMSMRPSMIWNGYSNRVSDEGDEYVPPQRRYTQKSKTVYSAPRSTKHAKQSEDIRSIQRRALGGQ
jgi:hypothetical protein